MAIPREQKASLRFFKPRKGAPGLAFSSYQMIQGCISPWSAGPAHAHPIGFYETEQIDFQLQLAAASLSTARS